MNTVTCINTNSKNGGFVFMGKDTKKVSEQAAFERCIDFMTRMIEKYGSE